MAEANESGQLIKAYGFNPVAGLRGLWSTDPIWQAKVQGGSLTDAGTQIHHLHTDHLGTPMLATDKTGSTSWKAVTEAFGAAGVLPQSSTEMNLRFPGQYWDEESQTHYNFNRDYRPNTGRYVQSDPIGLIVGVNLYRYPNNHPLVYSDSMGLYTNGDVSTFLIHYCRGSGTDFTTSFSSVNWGDLDARIRNAIQGRVGSSCNPTTIPIIEVVPAQTAGADRYIIGNHNVAIQGDLTINCDCSWQFQGKKRSSSGSDLYNTNKAN